MNKHSSPLSKVVGPTRPTPRSASTLASTPTSSLTSRTAVIATSSPGSQIPVTGAQLPLSARRASSALGTSQMEAPAGAGRRIIMVQDGKKSCWWPMCLRRLRMYSGVDMSYSVASCMGESSSWSSTAWISRIETNDSSISSTSAQVCPSSMCTVVPETRPTMMSWPSTIA